MQGPPGEKKPIPKTARGATSARGRNRPRELAEALKDWIAENALQPGDRLPQEKELIERFKASRGTVREALKLLEAQDLISIRTGPRGGAYVKDDASMARVWRAGVEETREAIEGPWR